VVCGNGVGNVEILKPKLLNVNTIYEVRVPVLLVHLQRISSGL